MVIEQEHAHRHGTHSTTSAALMRGGRDPSLSLPFDQ
jgi:hypothetical protein